MRERENLDESGGIGNVIPHAALSSDSNLVLVYRRLRLRLLHPLVPIHLLPNATKTQQTLLLHFSFQYMFLFAFRSKETEPQNIKRVEVTCFALTEASLHALQPHSLSGWI